MFLLLEIEMKLVDLVGVVGYSVVSYATDAGVGENNSMVTLGTRYRGR